MALFSLLWVLALMLGLSIIKFVFSGNVKINKNWLLWLSYSYKEVIQIFFYILESIAKIKLSFGAQQFEVIGTNSEENPF